MPRCRRALVVVVPCMLAAATAQQEPLPRLQGYPHPHDADAASFWRRPHLTGDWAGLRPWLQERGITPDLFATTDASIVAAGGLDRGDLALRSLLDATLAIDAGRLLGVAGGTLYLDVQVQAGDDGSLDTGDLQRYSDIDHTLDFEEVAMLWYEQAIADLVFVKVGKNDTNADFAFVGNGDHFVHPSFGHSPNLLAMPTYPDTAFGAQVFVRPDAWYCGVGVYDGAAQAGYRTGERGLSTVFGRPDDLWAIAEAGVQWSDTRPGRLGVGAWRHTGEFARFQGGVDDGTTGVYLVGDQELWRPDDADATRGLGAFAMYGWADPQVSPFEHHFGLGAAWRGPWQLRAADVVGLGASYATFSDAAGAGFRGEGELAVEAFYAVQATPWLSLTPVVHWIRDPGGLPDVDDALVFTVRSAVTF